MSDVRLSAALIVRDEEAFLEDCLKSLSACADEIVVVDTGSVDRSREIAADLGAHVADYPWHDDFAAARNRAIDLAHGEWILYIDADERVVEFPATEMAPLFADPGVVCHTVRFRPAIGFTRYREYRLFRKRPDLRFRGTVHESIVPDLELLMASGWRLGESPMALDHHGYDGDMRRKHLRNLPLLQARLERDPLHVYSWDQLGLTHLGLDDADAAATAWRHACEIVRAQPRRTEGDSMPFIHLATHLLDTGGDASALLCEALALFPDNHALVWQQARQHFEQGAFAEAQAHFARLAMLDASRIESSRLSYDASIFGANAHAALGLCAFRRGHYSESAAHYARAEAMQPDNLEFRAKHAFAAMKARQSARPAQ